MEESELKTTGDEEIIAEGFLKFGEEENAGFALKFIDMRSQIKNDLIAFAIGKYCLVAGTKKGILVRKKLVESEEVDTIQLGKQEITITKIYMDPAGYHCIITTAKMDTYYVNLQSTQPKLLKPLKGLDITAIALSTQTTKNETGPMLIGTRDGKIYTFELEYSTKETLEAELEEVFELPNNAPIYGIVYEKYESEGKDGNILGTVTLVMLVTLDTLYQLTGKAGSFVHLFSKYKNQADLDKHKQTLPTTASNLKQSELKLTYICNEEDQFELRSFAWKCSIFVYYGYFREKQNLKGHITIKDIMTEGYQKAGATSGGDHPIPESVCTTEHNIFLLYSDNLTVISRITKEIDHSETFKEEAKEIYFDYSTKSIWISTIRGIYRLIISGKGKDLWKKQLDSSHFKEALELCQQNDNKYYGYALGIYADSKFKNKKYNEAAELYSKSTKKFEEVVLKFLIAGENEALESILNN